MLPAFRISHTATGLLKIHTTESKPNHNTNPNPNPTNLTKPYVLRVYGVADQGLM